MKKATRDRLVLPILLPVGILAAIVLAMVLFSRILLSVTSDGATAVALIVGLSILGGAGLIVTRKRLSSAAGIGSLLGIVGGVALVAGGVALAVATPKAEHPQNGPTAFAASITAPPGAAAKGYSTSKLSFPADDPVDLKFYNEDPSVQHNVAIFSADPIKDPSAQALFTGSLETGPTTATYKIKALPAGTYYFHCDVHPTTMNGTLTVAGAAPSGGGTGGPSPSGGGSPSSSGAAPSGGVSVVAQGLAFNTDAINLAANTSTTLHWDNEDSGTPHNLSIYQDPSLPADTSAKKLFTFDPVPGPLKKDFTIPGLPAGTYVFQCDVHPTMDGTVTVT